MFIAETANVAISRKWFQTKLGRKAGPPAGMAPSASSLTQQPN